MPRTCEMPKPRLLTRVTGLLLAPTGPLSDVDRGLKPELAAVVVHSIPMRTGP